MKFSKVLTVTLALVIVLAGAFAAKAMDFGRHPHGAGLFGLKALLELNLTDDQKSQILSIYSKYDIKTARKNLWQAGKNLREALRATQQDENSYINGVATAYSQIAPLRQELFMMMAKMRYEIKAVLTPEQINKLLQQHRRGPQGASPTTPTP